ncbi:MAG: imidazoleglycerol-phosphate dehydratase HisB [Firmicutes bacterium]|nr:imidazoleglycerol-phosphate dehydratase HisB [Bacillota bacterium]
MKNRTASLNRKTGETEIELSVNIDGAGEARLSCGLPFFEHMLNIFCRHGFFDLTLNAVGDLEVDGHHLVEDVGLVLGEAFRQALGDKAGIRRYGSVILPMDDALVLVAVDLSGRPFLAFDLPLPAVRLGTFDTELVEEFFRAFVSRAQCTLHVKLLDGRNTHHIIEALFKALARALDQAVTRDERLSGIPSTKGVL